MIVSHFTCHFSLLFKATDDGFNDRADEETEYEYDENGNMTKDLNKNIADIQYNFLNLPKSLMFSNGDCITYTYDADGNKLRTVHKVGTETLTTDYVGNVVYENGTAERLLTEAGYVTLEDGKYHYFIQDHQGNNRVVVNEAGNVEETNHYYPFGGLFASSNSVQPYKYNGKELDNRNGLEWYDYGARFYDAAIGRFTTQDRFAEKYISITPYQYGINNPINNIDVNGDSVRVHIETAGWGHSWLSTGEGDDKVIYSYGRFNGTWKGHKGIHFANSIANGPGVLMRFTGKDADIYMKEKDVLGISTYVITDIEDAAVSKILDKKFYSSNMLPDQQGSKYYKNQSTHVVDDYKRITNNCTTLVSDVLNEAGSKALENTRILNTRFGPVILPVKERFILPVSLKDYLNNKAINNNSVVYKTK